MTKPLEGRIAVVAGATRGAGRGIATMLGEAGATVYCVGRSTRGALASGADRPETIEETAERVSAAGGVGLAHRADCSIDADVQALAARVRAEQGRLDVLVNDIWGGDELLAAGQPFWADPPETTRLMFERGVYTHVVSSRYLVPLMMEAGREPAGSGLIVEVTDGDTFGHRGHIGYDLAKMSVLRLAFGMAMELGDGGVTALAVTPGFLRSEAMLARFGVTEANWREGVRVDPHFIASESPAYVGRAVAALAADRDVRLKAGRVFASWTLAREYGFTDLDGSQPHWGEYFERAFGRMYRVADASAYATWRPGPVEVASGG